MTILNQGISRRNFIQKATASGIAMTLGFYIPLNAGVKDVIISTVRENDFLSRELIAWVSIDNDGQVTIMNHRSEMGQGTHQSIAQIIAEELEVNMSQIKVLSAAANPKKYGPQPQEGSFSIRGWYKQLLQIGASAREMLIETAAGQWKVDGVSCYAENGFVIHRPTSRKLGYGQLVEEASKLTPSMNVKLKSRSEYKLIGKSIQRVDTPSKVNGTAVFGLDKKVPGMLYAVVERNPRFRGKVKAFDDKATLAIPGVKHVLKVERAVFGTLCEGVAVVADSLWTAMQARKVLVVEWDDEGFEHTSTEELTNQKRENLKRTPSSPEFEAALQKTAKKIEAVYETPYQAHSCMEPLNCTVHVQPDRIDVWGPIQEANAVQGDLSSRLGIPLENVHVNLTFLGGGFGRKGFGDYPHEAALISKAIQAPVQVVWTREDDTTAGPFRTGAFYGCKGGIDDNGKITAFQAITAAQWIGQDWTPDPNPTPGTPSYNTGSFDGMVPPYLKAIPHFSLGGATTKSPVPVLWWRSVYASTNGYAAECFIDELALLAGKDPLLFRRDHLPDSRYVALVDKLIEVSGWSSRGKEKGWGVAITECFTGICAHIVQVVRTENGKVKITKVTALMDCGWYVNPDIIQAQVEGSIVMALGAAIKHEIHFKDGKTVERNFDTYKMPRITDTPEIIVHVMENHEKACGVGEPGLPPFAPALCNAIFDLTGKRIRKLPFNLEDI